MKTDDIVVLVAAAVAVLAILSTQKKTTSQPAPREVLDNGKPWANGWRYFDNGTAMDPTGQWFANV